MAITLRMWAATEDTEKAITALAAAHQLTGAALAGLLASDPGLAFSVESDRDTRDRAEQLARLEYRDTVRDLVTGLRDAVRDGDVTSRDEAEDRLHQDVDGHHDIIYTHAARELVNVSENGDAYFQEGYYQAEDFDGEIPWSKLAYFALLADVRDALGDLDEWFKCATCGGEVDADDLKATEGDNLPECAACKAEADGDDDAAPAAEVGE